MNKAEAMEKMPWQPEHVETSLRIRKAAEFHVPTFSNPDFVVRRTTPWDCIGYNHYGAKPSPCSKNGKFLVRLPDNSYALICGMHLRMFARREWIDPDKVRRVLLDVEIRKHGKALKRIRCLTTGKCL